MTIKLPRCKDVDTVLEYFYGQSSPSDSNASTINRHVYLQANVTMTCDFKSFIIVRLVVVKLLKMQCVVFDVLTLYLNKRTVAYD